MKSWRWLLALALITIGRGAEPNAAALRQVVDILADLDAVYVSVLGKKAPLKELETALVSGRGRLDSAAATSGIDPALGREIQAFAAVFNRTVEYMVKDTEGEELKFFRAADDLAELTRLARTMGKSVALPAQLTNDERRQLEAHVESRFGRKVQEFPRGDTSPFASNSRSPFASAMWVINLAFDHEINRTPASPK